MPSKDHIITLKTKCMIYKWANRYMQQKDTYTQQELVSTCYEWVWKMCLKYPDLSEGDFCKMVTQTCRWAVCQWFVQQNRNKFSKFIPSGEAVANLCPTEPVQERTVLVQQVYDKLRGRDKEVVKLILEGYTYQEIGTKYAVTRAAVGNWTNILRRDFACA